MTSHPCPGPEPCWVLLMNTLKNVLTNIPGRRLEIHQHIILVRVKMQWLLANLSVLQMFNFSIVFMIKILKTFLNWNEVNVLRQEHGREGKKRTVELQWWEWLWVVGSVWTKKCHFYLHWGECAQTWARPGDKKDCWSATVGEVPVVRGVWNKKVSFLTELKWVFLDKSVVAPLWSATTHF